MIETITVGNQKGGVGKTTITCSGAARDLALGRTVGVIDCDPQGSSLHWVENRQREETRTGRDLGSARLYAEHVISEQRRNEHDDASAVAASLRAAHARLVAAGCSRIWIDCPSRGPECRATFAAHLAADTLIIPFQASQVDQDVILRFTPDGYPIPERTDYSSMLGQLADLREQRNASPLQVYFVLNDYLPQDSALNDSFRRRARLIADIMAGEGFEAEVLDGLPHRKAYRRHHPRGLTPLCTGDRPSSQHIERLMSRIDRRPALTLVNNCARDAG